MSNDNNNLPNNIGHSFVVDSFEDIIDPNDGVTTLREAINASNSLSGQNTISFNLAPGSVINLAEKLEITNDLNILGLGAESLTISGNNTFDNFFIDNTNVVFNGLTIANGLEGIDVGSNSTVTVMNSAFVNNADDGVQVSGNNNTLNVSATTFKTNGGDGLDINSNGNSISLTDISATGNTETGLEIDGTDNLLNVSNSSVTANGDDGIKIDEGG
ncbi:MAG: CSLREA domain-containing protein, partial [Nostocales cyanobacterium 94392]|nr:CSLREA domain-containing protein [Nostocales cyanobacterium 94392]